MKVIKLKTPEPLPPHIYKQDYATHMRICKYEVELARSYQHHDKPGYFIVYAAKCFKEKDFYIEIPGWPGETFRIDNDAYEKLREKTVSARPQDEDTAETITRFLIDGGYVEGTIVD